jgi:membrane-bound metal-dependent hydrolase YbcI (DUF457 family)
MFTLAINISYVLALLFPLLIVLYIYRNTKPSYFGSLISGVLLIIWAGISAAQLNTMMHDVVSIVNGNYVPKFDKTSISLWSWLESYINVWLYVFPGVCAALGVNLITTFINMERPKIKS